MPPERDCRRLAVVVSDHGRHDASSISALLRTALRCGEELTVHIVTSSAHATDAARESARSADLVIAVGGDGTVSDVATGIFGTGAALGIVPAGSTNIIARGLGIPPSPAHAIGLLAGPHALRRIDVGQSAGRVFLHLAGAGFDARVFMATNAAWKRRAGWLAYIPAAIKALRLAPSDVRVIIDETTIEERSSLVLIANGGSVIVPGFRLHPEISVDDGWLDVLIFKATTPFQIAATLGHAGRQQLNRSPLVTWRRGRRIHIDASPPLGVELDGDPRGATPREFHMVPAGIAVITPE